MGIEVGRIVDGHVHVASTRSIPKDFIRGAARNMAAAGQHLALSENVISEVLFAQHQDHSADALVAQMDRAGIDAAVLLAPDFSYALECELSADQLILFHHQIRMRHPGRFYVFQGIDPRGGQQALQTLERAARDYHFEGLKLYPPCGYSASDSSLWPFYDLCRAYGLPVLLHSGPTSPALSFEHSRPSEVDRAAKAFPEVNFIVAHGGVNHCEEALLLCAYRPNVFVDISGFPSVLSPDGWAAHLRRLFSLKLNHKIIFGTDWPLVGLTDTLEGCVAKLTADGGPMAGLPSDDVEQLFHRNIMGLMPERAALPSASRSKRQNCG